MTERNNSDGVPHDSRQRASARMPRQARLAAPGTLHHVILRGPRADGGRSRGPRKLPRAPRAVPRRHGAAARGLHVRNCEGGRESGATISPLSQQRPALRLCLFPPFPPSVRRVRARLPGAHLCEPVLTAVRRSGTPGGGVGGTGCCWETGRVLRMQRIQTIQRTRYPRGGQAAASRKDIACSRPRPRKPDPHFDDVMDASSPIGLFPIRHV